MDTRLKENIDGVGANYILPFFWQHGESHDELRREIDAIYNSGIRAFCAESRVYEKFAEEPWWHDFGFMLEEAKKRGMQVWLLDDKHFRPFAPSWTSEELRAEILVLSQLKTQEREMT